MRLCFKCYLEARPGYFVLQQLVALTSPTKDELGQLPVVIIFLFNTYNY